MTAHIKDFIEQEFYHFHSHPELSYQEFETTKRLKEDLEKKSKTQEDIILMMNSYSCPKEIALKVKEVYTLMNKEELENKLFEFTTKQNIALRSWY